VFIVIEGTLCIEFRDGTASLEPGEMFVVPKGVEHKPFAEKECKVMLIEPKGMEYWRYRQGFDKNFSYGFYRQFDYFLNVIFLIFSLSTYYPKVY